MTMHVWGLNSRRTTVDQGEILHLENVDSTMDAARKRRTSGETSLIAVRADFQSKGRGRRGNVWLAPAGSCLLITYLVPASGLTPAMAAFAAGLAVAEGVEQVCDVHCGLKWPNDVMASGRKIAGVLIELLDPDTLLVGIGVNVNIAEFPNELKEIAASVEIETGLLFDLDDIESAVRSRLFELIQVDWSEIRAQWQERSVTTGIQYEVEPEGIRGIAEGVSDEGLLILQTKDGLIETMAASSIRS